MNRESVSDQRATPGRSPLRRLALRTGLALISISVLLLTLELALQIGALFVGGAGRDASGGATSAALRVLCMGDSNTWGLYVEPDEAWPAQLEIRWPERDGRTLQVVNMGYPGVNSSRVRAEIARAIDKFQPDITIVMVGANDHWTTSIEDSGAAEAPGSSPSLLVAQHSRVYKLAYMLWQTTRSWEPAPSERAEGGRFVVGQEVFDLSHEERPLSDRHNPREPMLDNLRAIVERAREGGTTLVLMTYPAQETKMYYPFASRLIRNVADETKAPLIDLNVFFEEQCRDAPCLELLFEDGHANAKGHGVIADEVSRQLEALLESRRPD